MLIQSLLLSFSKAHKKETFSMFYPKSSIFNIKAMVTALQKVEKILEQKKVTFIVNVVTFFSNLSFLSSAFNKLNIAVLWSSRKASFRPEMFCQENRISLAGKRGEAEIMGKVLAARC